MATLAVTNPTLLDVTRRLDPQGKIDKIAELLSERNEILDDMTWIEGNLATGHRSTMRTGLPAATWRKLYGGVQPTKSRTVQITDSAGMLEAYAEVDAALADLNGNTNDFRLSENMAHIQGMSNDLATALFYGDTDVNPERIMGLSPRFDSKSAENGENILLGGGSNSDNMSVWLVVWGPNTCHGFYPKGSRAGLAMNDKGQVTVENVDGSDGRAEMYRTHYRWDSGLTVRDWQYVVRIANIDASDLTKDASSGADLIDLMVQALELVPSLSMGRPAFYCNRKVKSFLRRQITNKSNVELAIDTVAGKRVMSFGDVPVRRCDALVETEATIS
jgi:hypothetical protein